ncbi:hypothetical protein DFH28DRAFT_899491 [Melampsora americana]|nr:hypothetical protein DFH28DRAFT_899491 [Melampsora americana]
MNNITTHQLTADTSRFLCNLLKIYRSRSTPESRLASYIIGAEPGIHLRGAFYAAAGLAGCFCLVFLTPLMRLETDEVKLWEGKGAAIAALGISQNQRGEGQPARTRLASLIRNPILGNSIMIFIPTVVTVTVFTVFIIANVHSRGLQSSLLKTFEQIGKFPSTTNCTSNGFITDLSKKSKRNQKQKLQLISHPISNPDFYRTYSEPDPHRIRQSHLTGNSDSFNSYSSHRIQSNDSGMKEMSGALNSMIVNIGVLKQSITAPSNQKKKFKSFKKNKKPSELELGELELGFSFDNLQHSRNLNHNVTITSRGEIFGQAI